MPGAAWAGTKRENFEKFVSRLQPELDMNDLEQRAKRAHEYCLEAIANLDEDKLARAVDRLFQRWEQWDAIAPAAWPWAQVWKTRHAMLWTLLEAMGESSGGEVFEKVLQRAYLLAALDAGESLAKAADTAWELITDWRWNQALAGKHVGVGPV